MIIQLSTFGTVSYEEKMIPIRELRPDMACLNMKCSLEEIEFSAKIMKELGIIPVFEIETSDVGAIERANQLIERSLIEQPAHFDLAFDKENIPGKSLLDNFDDLSKRIKTLWPGSIWSRARGAQNQFELDAMTILLGGHVRVGLEDNLYILPNQLAESSAQFSRRVRELSSKLSREVATVEEARRLIRCRTR